MSKSSDEANHSTDPTFASGTVMPEGSLDRPEDEDEWTFWQKHGIPTRAYIDKIKDEIRHG
jgi:hypothetical protein